MDVNDCVPEFSSPFYDFTVAENTKPGSVVAHLTAVDKDDGNNGQVRPLSYIHFYLLITHTMINNLI